MKNWTFLVLNLFHFSSITTAQVTVGIMCIDDNTLKITVSGMVDSTQIPPGYETQFSLEGVVNNTLGSGLNFIYNGELENGPNVRIRPSGGVLQSTGALVFTAVETQSELPTSILANVPITGSITIVEATESNLGIPWMKCGGARGMVYWGLNISPDHPAAGAQGQVVGEWKYDQLTCCPHETEGDCFKILSTVVSPTQLTPPCDGSIFVQGVGGIQPYSYQWDSGGNSQIEEELCPGVYQITVTDGSGQSKSVAITVN